MIIGMKSKHVRNIPVLICARRIFCFRGHSITTFGVIPDFPLHVGKPKTFWWHMYSRIPSMSDAIHWNLASESFGECLGESCVADTWSFKAIAFGYFEASRVQSKHGHVCECSSQGMASYVQKIVSAGFLRAASIANTLHNLVLDVLPDIIETTMHFAAIAIGKGCWNHFPILK